MALSHELISEFVKITNDNKKGKDEKTVYGTVSTVSEDGKSGTVKIDGSDEATPVSTTCTMKEGERVRLNIRNHNAIVTGNVTDISASAAELLEALTKIIGINTEIDGINVKIDDKVAEINLKIGENSVKIDEMGTTITGLATFQDGLEDGTTTIHGGCIDTDTLNLKNCISFGDLSDSTTYNNKINGAVSDASDALGAAERAQSTANGVDETLTALLDEDDKTTYIDGSKIVTESLYVDKIKLGEMMTVYKELSGDDSGGYLGYDDGFNSSAGIGIRDSTEYSQVVCTDAAARISYGDPENDTKFAQVVTANSGKTFIGSSHGTFFELDNVQALTFAIHDGFYSLRPYQSDLPIHLGTTSSRWDGVYCETCNPSTSDRNLKNSIEDLPSKYVTMFDLLTPKRYKLNSGTSGRYHIGYIAQDVEDAMNAVGIDSQEFGGLVKGEDENGNVIYMLRYDEFDGMRDAKIKRLENDFLAVKSENEELKARIEKLEKLLTQNT